MKALSSYVSEITPISGQGFSIRVWNFPYRMCPLRNFVGKIIFEKFKY